MIPIRRGQEPQQLREQRWWRLARARAYVRANQRTDKLVFAGYEVHPVRPTLHLKQLKKCAYCDRLHEASGQPIEHFRPKKGALRADGSEDKLHYWWLAWSWDNLLFACVTCNNQEHKGNRFPLLGDPLSHESVALNDEDAGIIDPTREHPMDHIQFRFDGRRWRPQGTSDKGRHTIEVFKLDERTELLELYQRTAAAVEESLGQLRVALQRGDRAALADLWRRRVAKHLGQPSTEFLQVEHAALVWDMFDDAFPKDVREQYGLALPRPGRRLPDDPPVADLRTPAAWATFGDETIWALRAVGKRTPKPKNGKTSTGHHLYTQHVRAALLAVLNEPGYQPLRADALRALLAQPPNTCALTDVQTALTALQLEGRATHDATADLWSLAPSSP